MESQRILKVIFLDIDGVLNWIGTEARIGARHYGLDPELIANFNQILDAHPDARVVISSTWRRVRHPGTFENFDELVAYLKNQGLRGDIIGHTPIKMSPLHRGSEIRMWIEEWEAKNPGAKLVYAILDDDTSGMQGYSGGRGLSGEQRFEARDLRPFHVVTYWTGDPSVIKGDGLHEEGGLRARHVAMAIKLLHGEPLTAVTDSSTTRSKDAS